MVDRALYDEAIDAYAHQVANRSLALYRVGNITFPGLSDLDLLLVVNRPAGDNDQYFSVYERLPKRLHCLFLHEPFIVPSDTLSIIRRTSHTNRILIRGDDLLRCTEALSSPEERWCKLFESFCNYTVFVQRVEMQRAFSGRLMIAVANTMRYALRDFDQIANCNEAFSYVERIDGLRALVIMGRKQQMAMDQIWNEFLRSLTWLSDNIKLWLPLTPGESIKDFALQFLEGHRKLGTVNVEAIVARYREIATYYARLRRLNVSFGQLFYGAAYPKAQAFQQSIGAKALFRSYYRARRLLERM